MALATRCPACSTVFRISTAQAAAKGGMVRCGSCRNVFNSLDALVRVEDLDVIEEVVIQPAAEAPLVGDALPHDAAGAVDVPPPDAFTALPDHDEEATAEVDDGRAEPSFSEPASAGESEWWLPDAEPRLIPEGRTSTPPPPHVDRPTGPHGSPSRPLVEPDEPAPEPMEVEGTNPVFMRPAPVFEPAPRAMRWTLGLLSIVAALALLGQLAYLWRDELAVRWPPARPWLTSACRALGCAVGYPVHAEAITIESAAVQTLAPSANAYVLTALLRNRDPVDLRYPTLELVLTDLQDRPILRRDLRPEDYLAGIAGHSVTTGFPAQSELPIRITFELTGLSFAGYRLNQLYP